MNIYRHDPDARLDYRFDWSAWLAEQEIIDTHQVIVSGDATVQSSADGTSVTVWVEDAEPRSVRLTCRVSTSHGRTDDRTIRLLVKDR
jgi:hypothetical protein